jgi:hypothetical protein
MNTEKMAINQKYLAVSGVEGEIFLVAGKNFRCESRISKFKNFTRSEGM